MTTTQLLMDLRKSFQHKEGPSEGELVDRHVNAPLLVLDDLGTEQLKDYAFTVLFHIIDQRYTWGRPLIVTSNLDLGALSAGFSDRVASRLAEMCAVLDLGNQDRRVGR